MKSRHKAELPPVRSCFETSSTNAVDRFGFMQCVLSIRMLTEGGPQQKYGMLHDLHDLTRQHERTKTIFVQIAENRMHLYTHCHSLDGRADAGTIIYSSTPLHIMDAHLSIMRSQAHQLSYMPGICLVLALTGNVMKDGGWSGCHWTASLDDYSCCIERESKEKPQVAEHKAGRPGILMR